MAQNFITQRILKIVELMIKNKIIKSGSAMARSLSYRPQSYDKVKNSDRNFPLDVIYTFVNLYKINPVLLFNDEAWQKVCNANGEIEDYNALLLHPSIQETPTVKENNSPVMVVTDTQKYISQYKDPIYINRLQHVTCDPIDLVIEQGRALQIQGDDMEPNFVHGDWIIGGIIKDYDSLLYNRIYTIVTTDNIIVRRIVSIETKKGHLVLGMDNHGYPNYTIAVSTVLEIWEVHRVLKSRFPMPIES